jgi:hypothetical protein
MGPGQDFITEGGDPASAADIDGDGADEGLQRLAFAPPAVVDAGTAVARCSRQPIRTYQRRALEGFADPEPGAGLSYAADGASFLTAPAIADLGGDGKPDVIRVRHFESPRFSTTARPRPGGRSSRAAGRSSRPQSPISTAAGQFGSRRRRARAPYWSGTRRERVDPTAMRWPRRVFGRQKLTATNASRCFSTSV